MTRTRNGQGNSHLFSIVSAALLISAFYFAKEILLPVALAVFLSFVLTPMVQWLERRQLPRLAAVGIVAVIAFSILGALGYFVTNQILELSQKLPAYKGNLVQKVRTVNEAAQGTIKKATETIEDFSKEINQQGDSQGGSSEGGAVDPIETHRSLKLWDYLIAQRKNDQQGSGEEAEKVKVVSLPPSPLQQIKTWLGPIVGPLTTAGLVILITLFLLARRDDMRNRILLLIGTAHLRVSTEAIDDVTKRVSDLLRMQLIINSLYGVCLAVGLYLIGLPNAMLWGVLAAVLRFLPYLGPWLAAAFPITLSLAVFDDWTHVLTVMFVFVVLEVTVNSFLEPWLYGASMGVSSLGVIVAAIFWTWMWGPVGLVLAMPVTVCLVVAGKYVPSLRFLTILFGDQSMLTVEEQFYQRLLALDEDGADRLFDEQRTTLSCTQLYDSILIPALCLAEVDRHAGALKEAQELAVLETTQDLVEQCESTILAERKACDAHRKRPLRALCVPARDEADYLTARMLSQLLTREGIISETRSNDRLASELADDAQDVDVIAISALPPGAARHATYLCKRLRAKLPDVHIVVGLWRGATMERTQMRLKAAGATCIVMDLEQALQEVKSLPNLPHLDTEIENRRSYRREVVPLE